MLSIRRGGFGLRSLGQHSPAAYLASLCASGIISADMEHRVERAREQFDPANMAVVNSYGSTTKSDIIICSP